MDDFGNPINVRNYHYSVTQLISNKLKERDRGEYRGEIFLKNTGYVTSISILLAFSLFGFHVMTNVHDHCGRPTDFTVAIKLDSKFLRDILIQYEQIQDLSVVFIYYFLT